MRIIFEAFFDSRRSPAWRGRVRVIFAKGEESFRPRGLKRSAIPLDPCDMSDVARLRAELAAWKAAWEAKNAACERRSRALAACERRDRQWVAAFSECEVFANYWRMDNNQLHSPLDYERPIPWEDFVGTDIALEANPTAAPASAAARREDVPERPREAARVAEAPSRSREVSTQTCVTEFLGGGMHPIAIEGREDETSDTYHLSGIPASRSPRYSKYNGVERQSATSFKARIAINSKPEYLGCFSSDIEAAKAYDTRARQIGRLRRLNFPTAADEAAASASGGDTRTRNWPGDGASTAPCIIVSLASSDAGDASAEAELDPATAPPATAPPGGGRAAVIALREQQRHSTTETAVATSRVDDYVASLKRRNQRVAANTPLPSEATLLNELRAHGAGGRTFR